MTQITEEQRALHANELASASPGNPSLRAAAQQNPDFPKPEVPSAPGGVLLNPHLADPSGISVKVYYPTMDATDVIGLIFNGNNTFVTQKGSAAPDHTVTFQVPKEEVAKALGKTVEVSYVVGRDAGPGLSQTLNLVVNPIPPSALPAPEIDQATGGTLDVQVLQTDADVFVSAWPLIAVGQRLWLSLKGFKSGGASHNLDLPSWQGYEIVSTEAQGTKAPLSYLQELADGSHLVLELKIAFDGGVTRLSFPDQLYTIKIIPEFGAINITTITDSSGAAIANGGSTGDTTVNLTGTADANAQLQIVDGSTVLGTVNVNSTGAWTFHASGLSVSTHIFAAKYVGNALVSDTWTIQVVVLQVEKFDDNQDQAFWIGISADCKSLVLTVSGAVTPFVQFGKIESHIAVLVSDHSVAGSITMTATLKGTYSAVLIDLSTYLSQPRDTDILRVEARNEVGEKIFSKDLPPEQDVSPPLAVFITGAKIKYINFTTDTPGRDSQIRVRQLTYTP